MIIARLATAAGSPGSFLFLCVPQSAEDAITRCEAMISAFSNYRGPAADDRLQRAGLWFAVPGFVLFAAGALGHRAAD
jgi:hypothetical protein